MQPPSNRLIRRKNKKIKKRKIQKTVIKTYKIILLNKNKEKLLKNYSMKNLERKFQKVLKNQVI